MRSPSAVERNTYWRSVGTVLWLPAQRYPLGMALMALLISDWSEHSQSSGSFSRHTMWRS